MKFSFTAIVKLTLDHTPGEKQSKHVSTDFLLEMSKGLMQTKYLDAQGLPTRDGCHVISRTLTSGLAAVIHHAHIKGYRNDVEHIQDATTELARQFATSADTKPGTLERFEALEINTASALSQFIDDEKKAFNAAVNDQISEKTMTELKYLLRYLETFEMRLNEFTSKNNKS